MTKIYAIFHKPSDEFVSFQTHGGIKVAWGSTGALKNAFKLHMRFYIEENGNYEIVDLTETYYRLEDLKK